MSQPTTICEVCGGTGHISNDILCPVCEKKGEALSLSTEDRVAKSMENDDAVCFDPEDLGLDLPKPAE